MTSETHATLHTTTSSRVWYRAMLDAQQVATGHVAIITRRFVAAIDRAGKPAAACLFVTAPDTVYFSPSSISAIPSLLARYRAEPSEPPERMSAELLVGTLDDWNLLPRLFH